MNTPELIATVVAVGGLVPPLIAVIQRPTWSTRTRTLVAGGLSVVVGAGVYLSAEGLDVSSPSKIVAVILGVWLASSAAYQGIWTKLGAAQAIEQATTPAAARFNEGGYTGDLHRQHDEVEGRRYLDADGDGEPDVIDEGR